MTKPEAREPAETSVARTYQYLRIGIGAAGILIGVSIAIDLLHGGESRESISAFYDSDARNIFVGALFAVSIGLFALSGWGPQRLLLDAAAMFAPLIGLIPGPEATWDPPAVDRGVWTYLVFGGMLVVFVLILRGVKSRRDIPLEDPKGFWWSIVIGVAWLGAVAVTFLAFPECFREIGHLASAGAFFVLTGIIAIVHWHERSPAPDSGTDPCVTPSRPATVSLKRIYLITGIALLGDVAAVIAFQLWWKIPGSPVVAILEAVALALFSFFWFVQSWQRGPASNPQRLHKG